MRALLFLVAFLLVQAPQPNPDDYVGEEDPAHQGQPKSCSNSAHIKAVKQDCKCVKTNCDPAANMEDPKCYVYCRKPACKCEHGCHTN